MKSAPLPIAAFLAFSLPLLPEAALALKPGDSRETVESLLGPAPSYLSMGSRDVLIYDRGRVILVDDVVTEMDLLTPAQFEAREERRAAAAARRAAAEEDRLRALTEAVRARTEALRQARESSTPQDRYDAALQALREEEENARREKEREATLVRLETRVLEAQADALKAEASAAQARQRAADAERTAQELREQQALAATSNPCPGGHPHGDPCYVCGGRLVVDAYAYPVRVVHSADPSPGKPVKPRDVEELGGRYSTQRRFGTDIPLYGDTPPRWGR